MTNEESYEYYGWLANNLGFFLEWRKEVSKRLIELDNKHDTTKIRSDLSMIVYKEMASNLPKKIKTFKNDENKN